ncbi:MAG: hypothetical protein KF802_11530 [Bdellovibrionaceae bacterium]|nr:hypothetical protein [Pseudobdellovibrionaceae bacterium]MBX3032749.1 hypothetical protein [Pseudobdellovibrionaceae bacterium]
MRSFLFAFVAVAALLVNAPAVAKAADVKEVMTCTVPNGNAASQVSASIVLQAEASADYVIVNVNDKGQNFRLFTQTDKGDVAQSIEKGSLGFLLLQENFTQDAGVIRNAGFLVISKRDTGAFEGLMGARSNIYPLTCTLK